MNVLLTGHRGFIGAAIDRHLSRNEGKPALLLARDGSELRLGAEDSLERMLDELPPMQTIIHSAASLKRDALDGASHRTNYLGVQQVLAAAAAWKTERLIFLSSVSVYAPPASLPIKEDSELRPADVYAVAKVFGEVSFMSLASPWVFPICFRICSPVGPGIPANRLLAKWHKKARGGERPDVLGQGTKVQHYVDVRDIALAVELAIQRREVSGVFNLAGPDAVSNSEMARLCIQELCPGLEVDFIGGVDPSDGERWVYDIEKLRGELGFTPRFSLNDSIRAMGESR